MTGEQNESGGVAVQTTDSMRGKAVALLLKIKCKRVAQCVVVMPLRRMHRHAGGFVEHKQIRILVNDVERKIVRHDILRGREGGEIHTQRLPRLCPDNKIDRSAVQTDTVRDFFQTDEQTAGKSMFPQNILNRNAVALRQDHNRKRSSCFHEDSVPCSRPNCKHLHCEISRRRV